MCSVCAYLAMFTESMQMLVDREREGSERG